MKTLYNEFFAAVTDDANELYQRLWKANEEIFDDFLAKGYSPRELAGFFHDVVGGMAAEKTLRLALKMRKEKLG